jgi:hypothetical protein
MINGISSITVIASVQELCCHTVYALPVKQNDSFNFLRCTTIQAHASVCVCVCVREREREREYCHMIVTRWSAKLLLALVTTVILGFESHQNPLPWLLFCPRHLRVLEVEEHYVCCTIISAQVYLRCHGFQVTVDSVHHLSVQACALTYLTIATLYRRQL